MCVASCSVFVVGCLWFVVCCLLLSVRRASLVVCRSLFVGFVLIVCLVLRVCCLFVGRSLFVCGWLLSFASV